MPKTEAAQRLGVAMRGRNYSALAQLLLMEQLLALLFFALAAAVGVQLFAAAHDLANQSRDLDRGVLAAENGAECFKAAGGDLQQAAALLDDSARVVDGVLVCAYDSAWQPIAAGSPAYLLEITARPLTYGAIGGLVRVLDSGGGEIFCLDVAARGVAL